MAGHVDYEQMVELHHAALYRFALSLSRNEADAGDLVQETYYLLAAKGHQIVEPSRVRSWLFTTLHRAFLAGRRRLIRFPHQELSEVAEEIPLVPPALPESVDAELLLDCLGRMDEVFRAPVALFYLEDCPYAEIAEILDIPLGTVKSRIARGLVQLQKMLVDRPAGARWDRYQITPS